MVPDPVRSGDLVGRNVVERRDEVRARPIMRIDVDVRVAVMVGYEAQIIALQRVGSGVVKRREDAAEIELVHPVREIDLA